MSRNWMAAFRNMLSPHPHGSPGARFQYLGTINPIEEMISLAHQLIRSIPVLTDAARHQLHFPIDVQALDVDFSRLFHYVSPTGVGIL